MKIQVRNVDGICVVDLRGKLTAETDLTSLHDVLEKALDEDRHRAVLNLENVPWVDSGGIGAIMRAYFAFKRRGGRLKICSPSPRVDEALLTVDLRNIFDIYATESGAIASFLTRLTGPDPID
jgi:anti-sigma B factor antagonist